MKIQLPPFCPPIGVLCLPFTNNITDSPWHGRYPREISMEMQSLMTAAIDQHVGSLLDQPGENGMQQM